MRKYIVNIKPNARKKLAKINPLLRVRISRLIDSLENFDFVIKELDVKKLKWYEYIDID